METTTRTAEAPTKIARILAHLLAGASINRFEAERLGDHCLNSTIAVLANRHGLPASEHGKACKVLALMNQQAKGSKGVAV